MATSLIFMMDPREENMENDGRHRYLANTTPLPHPHHIHPFIQHHPDILNSNKESEVRQSTKSSSFVLNFSFNPVMGAPILFSVVQRHP